MSMDLKDNTAQKPAVSLASHAAKDKARARMLQRLKELEEA